MSSNNQFFEILDKETLTRFGAEVGELVKCKPGIMKSKVYARITKRHESGRIKGFAEKYSGKIRKNITADKPSVKGKYGIKLFEIAFKQAMPAIEKEITKLSVI